MRATILLLSASAAAANPLQKFATQVVAPKFFAWFASSEGVAKIHKEHVEGDTVRHMMKGTPMASASDEAKLDFARSSAGAAVADFMKLEQQHIGQWKIDKIVEAAGADFDAAAGREEMLSAVGTARVVVFSFIDCPWCLLAKERLQAMALSESEPLLSEADVRFVELEDLGREGKALRGAIALATGRTSMPSVWVDGVCVGGYTDGEMGSGDAPLCLAASPGLEELSNTDGLRRLLASGGGGQGGDDEAAAKQPPARTRGATMMAELPDTEWGKKVFTAQNAAPWAILIAVIAFEGLALLPRESLPPLLQQLIPLVLGKQYAPPS